MKDSVCFTTAFDESVFDDDPFEVMKKLAVWYTLERHELIDSKQPFGHWLPHDNAITDMTWLAFGFNLKTQSYAANPYDQHE